LKQEPKGTNTIATWYQNKQKMASKAQSFNKYYYQLASFYLVRSTDNSQSYLLNSLNS